MKVLITGAAGQLGRALLSLPPPGWQVRAMTRAELDLRDCQSIVPVVEAFRPNLIINAAAYTAVDRAEHEPEIANVVNTDAVVELATAAHHCSARLVQISTDFVFDGRSGSPYSPEAPPNPLNVYGASKAAGEVAALRYPHNLVVRTSWVYAAGSANFVETMLRLLTEKGEVNVVADQIGTPTHAASLAASIWTLAREGAEGIFHATDEGVASWYDFAVAIAEEATTNGILSRPVFVRPIPSSAFPTSARRPSYSVLAKEKTRDIIGPARHWRVELRDMLHRLRRNRNG